MLRKSFVLAGALAGGLSASQVPEFTQQYQQRLSGAVNELQLIVADFDKDALQMGLDRRQALDRFVASADEFLVERGQSMSVTIERFEQLSEQLRQFQTTDIFQKALSLGAQPDQQLISDTMEIYKPAVPVTAQGFVFAGLGLLFGGGLLYVLATLLGWPFRRRVRINP